MAKYSNCQFVDMTILSGNYTPKTAANDGIIIHTMAGNMWTSSCGYMFQQSTTTSSNYGIGSDGTIGLYVEEKNRAYTSGGYDAQGNIKRANGVSGRDMDMHCITIEVASLTQSEPFKCSDAAWKSLIKLCADICKRNGIKKLMWLADPNKAGEMDKQNMAVHRWFASKSCPGDYLFDNMGLIADEVNKLLGLTTNYHKYDQGKQTIDKVVNIPDTSVPASSKPATTPSTFKKGDIVQFNGGSIYGGSNSSKVANTISKTSTVRITNVVSSASHPYHAISEDNKGVYGWVDASTLSAIGQTTSPSAPSTSTTTTPSSTTTTSSSFKSGDILKFSGGNVYASSDANTAAKIVNKSSTVKITNTSLKAKHPYHAISQDNGGVYGWVDANKLQKTSNTTTATPSTPTVTNTNYTVKVTRTINIRKGPGTTYEVTKTISSGVYTIVQESTGPGATMWGKLKSGAGWIALDYVTKLK